MQQCQVCGKQNPAGVEYCEDCGASFAPGSGQAVSGPQGAGAAAATPAGAAPSAEATGGVAPPTPSAPTGNTPSGAGLSAPPPAEPAPSLSAAAPGAAAAPQSAVSPLPPATTPSPSATAVSGPPASPPAPQGTRTRLVAKRFGALTSEEIPLLAERLVVGRFDPETGPVDIDLSGAPEVEHISRQHGELYREGDGSWLVRDLGSTNGVFVKGKSDPSFGPRITAPRSLSDGDELAFGNARFVFKTE